MHGNNVVAQVGRSCSYAPRASSFSALSDDHRSLLNVCHFKMVHIDAIRPHADADKQILQSETFTSEAIIS